MYGLKIVKMFSIFIMRAIFHTYTPLNLDLWMLNRHRPENPKDAHSNARNYTIRDGKKGEKRKTIRK